MSRNQRLYAAMRQAGIRPQDIADGLDVDPKTIGRWITDGRLPRPHHRRELAQMLGVAEAVLWPDAPGAVYGTSELVGIYSTRRELPPATVSSMLDGAHEHIDVLAYAALWLWDTIPSFVERVQVKIAQGASVRICLGNPDSEGVRLRGQEEGVDDALAGRCRLAIAYARGIQHVDPNALRLSGATLYASIFRVPRSPSAIAPASASIKACDRTSPSECVSNPTSVDTTTPPRTSSWPGDRRWMS